MTREQYEILCREEVRQAIDANIDRDPIAVALDRRIPHAAEVATQVKYLQRAQRKLPSYREARCILPSLAFEQSSGELCAQRKRTGGRTALDLTCGLGVDAFAAAQRFERVVAVERDEVVAAVARENFRRLGIGNVEVVCSSAEEFVARCGERFDWCFADPDRRGTDGLKKVVAADCSPDVVSMLPRLKELARNICIKMSPMFDVDEAFRLFGRCSVEAVSLGDECKEVVVYIDDREPTVAAVAVGRGEFRTAAETPRPASDAEFAPASYRWLIVPDVALRKARLTQHHLAGRAFVPGVNGCGFAVDHPGEVVGRVFEIESMERYEPRRLRRTMKGCRPEIMMRDVPLTLSQIEKATGLRNGSDGRMLFTSVGGEIWVIRLK